MRQIRRWTKGHNSAMYSYSWRLLRSKHLSRTERLDGLLLLGVYMISPLLLLAWIASAALIFVERSPLIEGVLGLLALAAYSALGNFAIFFQIATAVRLDGNQRRVRLLPLNQLGFLVSMVVIARATVSQWIDGLFERRMHWDKTRRYRKPGAPS
jgi:hypothetical protein